MRDFPPISKEDNPQVLAELITAYVKESGGIILDRDTPDIPDDAPLRVRAKRTKEDDDSEAAIAVTNYDSVPPPRGKEVKENALSPKKQLNYHLKKIRMQKQKSQGLRKCN